MAATLYANVPIVLRITGRVMQCIILAAFCALAVLAYGSSALSNILIAFLMVALIAVLVSRGFAIGNGNLRMPWRGRGWGLFGSLARVSFYGLAAVVTYFGSIHRALGIENEPYIIVLPIVGFLILAAISLFPRKISNWPYTIFCAVMTPLLLGVLLFGLREPSKNVYVVNYPIAAAGTVMHGGPSLLTNYHYIHQSQKHAFDIGGLSENGIMEAGDPLIDDDCFGASVVAVTDGKIAKATSGFPDVDVGQRGEGHPAGNHILLEFEPQRYALYAHLKAGSIQVEEGQIVKMGDIIGACGNSGNTSQPHLHFQIQNQLDLFAPDNQTYPVRFTGLTRLRSGKSTSGQDVALRRNDIIYPEVD